MGLMIVRSQICFESSSDVYSNEHVSAVVHLEDTGV